MAVTLSQFAGVGAQFFDSNGVPLAGGKIYSYQAGTTTPLATYTTNLGNVARTNPIILDAAGRVPGGGEIWVTAGAGYKFVLTTSTDVLVATYDNVPSADQPGSQNDADAIFYEQGYTVNAGSFVTGKTYRILSVGNTDFTLIGASSNTVGLHFIATGAGTGSGTAELSQTVEAKLQQTVNVADFGAVGDGVTDDTTAIQAAINTNKSVQFNKGTYICGPVTIPLNSAGVTISGSGAVYYPSGVSLAGTLIKARDNNQTHIFSHANGADSVTYSGLRLEGAGKALKLIDGTYGAWITLENCKLQNYLDYGFFNRQGLARIDNCFFASTYTSGAGIGASLYSDWHVTNTEFTTGNIPLEIVAGGGRAVNILANSGKTCCVKLAPLNNSTTHINTSFTNCYFGEVYSGSTTAPIVQIKGTAVQLVQQVQFSNSFLVCADTSAADKVNGGVYIEYAREVAITGVVMLGYANASVTATRRTDYFVSGVNSTYVSITGCIAKSINRNNVFMDTACFGWKIQDNNFVEYASVAAAISTATDGAAIFITDSTGYGTIVGNSFDNSTASSTPYAVEGGSPVRWVFNSNLIRYTSATIWTPAVGVVLGGYQRLGSPPFPAGQLSGSATYNPPSLNDGDGTTTTVTVTDAVLGDAVALISFSNDLQGITVTGWVSSANTVSVRFQNETGGVLDLASGTLRVRVQKIL